MKNILILIIFSIVINPVFANTNSVLGDTINTEYLKGEAKRLRQNLESIKTKADELLVMYGQYKNKTQKTCKEAYQEAKSAYDAAMDAKKESDAGMKLADKALSATNMGDAKKYLNQLDDRHKVAHELIKISEERKKEVEFEMKGCN